jgi:hypothetical protein
VSAYVQMYNFDTTSQLPSTLVANCGCLPLDGSVRVISCSGVARGTLLQGPCEFDIIDNTNFYAYNDFTVVHTQVTVTAATPSTTVTETDYATQLLPLLPQSKILTATIATMMVESTLINVP